MPLTAPERSSHRSRSPAERLSYKRHRSPTSHHHHHRSSKQPKLAAPAKLPFKASHLSKTHFDEYKPMFALYLDIQKQKILEDLPEDEVRGRWKSFVGKWNRGELAEGWYEPATLQKAQASASAEGDIDGKPKWRGSPTYDQQEMEGSSDEDLFGPTLPGRDVTKYNERKKPGPGIPSLQDLELQREIQHEDLLASRHSLNHARKLDRQTQKAHLDDLLPRADPGTKERLLEKKREKADSNRAFASAKTDAAGGVEEVPESDLLGDDADGGVEGFKKRKGEMERKKNEREVRREEVLRARMEERGERIREYKAKEERTMSGLIALAKAKFG